MTPGRRTAAPPVAAWDTVAPLAEALVGAWGSWAPAMTADGSRVAFVGDRHGRPQLWVQDVPCDGGPLPDPQPLPLGPDPVLAAGWSRDGTWISAAIATGGGVRSEVWIVRPDGSDARRVAGGPGGPHAALGPFARDGHDLVVTLSADEPGVPNECVAIDPETGRAEVVARGELVHLLDLSADDRFALVRDGTRGAQFCRLVDRLRDEDLPTLPYADTGSTDVGLLRPAPAGPAGSLTAYVVTDAGRSRRELVAVGFGSDGRRIAAGTAASRVDAELEFADGDDSGSRLLLVWNVAGRSEVELLDTLSGTPQPCPGLPGWVVSGAVLARDGASAVLAVEGPGAPRRLWRLDCTTLAWTPVTRSPRLPDASLVEPELVHFEAHDGLPLTGWLYRAGSTAQGPAPALVSLHGGPEAQERPVFSPQHQVLAAAGITVLAPNIRGSAGFGRAFVHADDRWGRFDAIRDVAGCAAVLVTQAGADPDLIAVGGRSYGGYATLLALAWHAPTFAAGVDICGMSDLLSFYRDTEPWIAAAAVSKYGDPERDAALLAELSPLHHATAIDVPLLVVHGELDTNVPVGEARQIVARLRELDRPVEYLQLAGEGHEYRRAESRLLLVRRLVGFLAQALSTGAG